MAIELKVPEVGESITEVEIGDWLKSEGEVVHRDDAVVMIETDKVTVELPAPVTGKVTQILVQKGETATVGQVIGYMEEGAAQTSQATRSSGEAGGGEAARSAPAGRSEARQESPSPPSAGDADDKPARPEAAEARTKSAPEPSSAPSGAAARPQRSTGSEAEAPRQSDKRPSSSEDRSSSGGSNGSGRVMPAAQRALSESGLSADQVTPTGPGGRMLKEDVQRAAARKSTRPPAPSADDSPSNRDEETIGMTPMRRRIAERLVEAQQTAALLTTFNEADMSAVMALRKQHQPAFQEKYGIKLGFMSFFVKAVVDALKLVPQVNAEIRGTDIVYKNYYDIGVAVGGGKGLVVPVIRNAEQLGFAEVELQISDFGKRAKDNRIKLEELQGGTFTISNGGVYGSMMSTPIINPPQSGILGLHAIQDRPVARDGQVVIRPMMYLALTYDHRLVDGREAVTFLKRIKETIEDPSRILLEV